MTFRLHRDCSNQFQKKFLCMLADSPKQNITDICQKKGTNTGKSNQFIWAAKEVHVGHCLAARVREESSWMTEWHLRRNFSSPWRVQVRHETGTGLENSAETAMPKEEPPRRRGGGGCGVTANFSRK